jgi:hypothetical protein
MNDKKPEKEISVKVEVPFGKYCDDLENSTWCDFIEGYLGEHCALFLETLGVEQTQLEPMPVFKLKKCDKCLKACDNKKAQA